MKAISKINVINSASINSKQNEKTEISEKYCIFFKYFVIIYNIIIYN